MRVHNVHERTVAGTPEAASALFVDMERLWPAPDLAPKPEGGSLRVGRMLWRPVERTGAVRAYDIVEPHTFPASHWFEVAPESEGRVLLRHTVAGEALGEFEQVWRDRIEPMHNTYIEAVFDRAQEALA
jgi:hypothetical protein